MEHMLTISLSQLFKGAQNIDGLIKIHEKTQGLQENIGPAWHSLSCSSQKSSPKAHGKTQKNRKDNRFSGEKI